MDLQRLEESRSQHITLNVLMKSRCSGSTTEGHTDLGLGLRESFLEEAVGGALEGQETRPLH